MSGPQVLAVIVIFVAFCLTRGWYAKRGVEREAEQTGRALTLGPDADLVGGFCDQVYTAEQGEQPDAVTEVPE